MLNQFQAPTGLSPVRNAVLFLFSPRPIEAHFHRPYEYNFRPAVMEGIIENIIRKPTVSDNVDLTMRRCPEINQAIVPSANGFGMNTQLYSNNWTFCLLTDIAESAASNMITRYITTGICLQEPIGNHGLASATPESFLNPNCTMMVTKQVVLNQHQTLGSSGAINRVKTLSDLNVVTYDDNVFANPQTTGQNYFVMTPSIASKSVAIDEFNDVSTVIDLSDALNVKRYDKVSAPIESPCRHMREIIRGVDTNMMKFMYSNQLGDFDTGLDGSYSTDAPMTFLANMGTTFDELAGSTQIYQNRSGIITDEFTLLGVLMTKFAPKVYPIQIQPEVNYDIIPQNITSPSTIFSSMVCAVVPTHMNAVNLSEVSFMYNSFHNAISVQHIGSALTCDNEQLAGMWKRFEFLIRNELFPVLLANCGEFDLQVMSSLNSTTNCVLNFLDFTPLPINTLYQENTILGGMISPLIGTNDTLVNNGLNLNTLLHGIADNININNANIY